jgi:hypothetical protein
MSKTQFFKILEGFRFSLPQQGQVAIGTNTPTLLPHNLKLINRKLPNDCNLPVIDYKLATVESVNVEYQYLGHLWKLLIIYYQITGGSAPSGLEVRLTMLRDEGIFKYEN